MLRKLLKYDLKWIYKIVAIFYVLAFIFSVIGRGLSEIKNSVVFSVTAQFVLGFAVGMMVNSFINCLMRLWARFIRNLYKDESYLTHTLPISKKTIYASKVISAIISIFTTLLVTIVCLFICYYSEANIEALKSTLELVASTYNTTVIKLLLLISFVIFLEILFIILIGYVGIVLGHKSNKNKLGRSIIIGFIIYMLMQTLTLCLLCIYGLISPSVMNLIKTTDTIDIDSIKSVMYVGSIIYVVYIIFLYILGQKQLEKGVNVE